jgi:hypothetical protein
MSRNIIFVLMYHRHKLLDLMNIAIVRQLILNNAAVGLQQWKRGVSMWSVLRCYKQGTKSGDSEFCIEVCEERT